MKSFQDFIAESSEVIMINLMCSKKDQDKQTTQIKGVIKSSGIEVNDNIISTEAGCIYSLTVKRGDYTNLLQKLRNTKSKVLGWSIQE